jgi:hypothetical protein
MLSHQFEAVNHVDTRLTAANQGREMTALDLANWKPPQVDG